jgi:penicillin-binding protein 1A
LVLWTRVRTRALDAARSLRRKAGGLKDGTIALGRPPVRRMAIWGGYAALGVALCASLFFVYVTWGMPSTDDLWDATDNPSLTILDRRGRVIIREGAQNAPPVKLDVLPDYVPQAVLAIEDRRFYKHMGVDVSGLLRAGIENIAAGRVVQGGSTITQQLAKNLFLTNERTFRRKAQEVALALWLEGRFSKEDILALYLSRVYFGAGAWGVEAAAERYFDKPAAELTLTEAALLAGLLKAPSRLNPAAESGAAKARAKVVLDEMLSLGFIDAARHKEAMAAPLAIRRSNPSGNLGYFRTWIDPILNEEIGHARQDFIIETTLDIEAQRAGERALDQALAEEGKDKRVSQGAVVTIDAEGGVRAMVGGRGFSDSQFNRVTQAKRQPGSAFKYFIYLTAMKQNISPFSEWVDEPFTVGDWAPANYEDEYFGSVHLTTAFAKSLNMVAIRLASDVGHREVIRTAKSLGIASPISDFRSLALGAQEMTVIELTGAFGAMASGGYRLQPFGVVRIKRANGDVVWEREAARERVVEEAALRQMNLIMRWAVDRGTGRAARIDGRQIGGKTGTGNDYRDAWFIGYTPGMVTGVWVGNDDFQPMRRITGGSLPTRIWRETMVAALRNEPVQPMLLPEITQAPAPIAPPPETPLLPAIEEVVPGGLELEEVERVVDLPERQRRGGGG